MWFLIKNVQINTFYLNYFRKILLNEYGILNELINTSN